MERNFDDLFVQSKNIADILLEQEVTSLEKSSKEMTEYLQKLYKNKSKKIKFDSPLVDDVDIAFIIQKDEVMDLSTSYFDTTYLIKNINYQSAGAHVSVFHVEQKGENYLILLKESKIINYENGQVIANLFVGNILNDDFGFLNKIKERANLKEVSLYVNGKYIASTQEKDQLKYSFDELSNSILKKENAIYAKKRLTFFHQDDNIDLVLLLDNQMLKKIKNDFFNQLIVLFLIILIIAVASYFIIRAIILNPLENLLEFASKVREDKNAVYEESFIDEFNIISLGLENIIGSLRDVEERYRLAVDGTKEGLWDWDIETGKVFYSQQYEEMLGYNANEIKGTLKSWQESIHPDCKEDALKKMKAHLKQETPYYEAEYQMRCKDGSYKWVRVRAKALYNNNIAYRMVGFHLDIEHIKLLEKKSKEQESVMTQQSKMAAIGEMINNISHQWRQPLSIISTVATGIKLKLEYDIFDKEEAIKELELLNTTSQNLSGIIDQFRDLAIESRNKEDFDSAVVLDKSLGLVESSFKELDIKLHQKLEHKQLHVYKNQLIQVVLNIVNNAKDAVAKLPKNELKLIFVETSTVDGYFTIRIYDNGGGVEEGMKESLYEPYMTSKHESQGTGLGLYTVKEIINKQFDGTVQNQTIKFVYDNHAYVGEEFLIQFK